MYSPALQLRENDVFLDWSVFVVIVTVSGLSAPRNKPQIIVILKYVPLKHKRFFLFIITSHWLVYFTNSVDIKPFFFSFSLPPLSQHQGFFRNQSLCSYHLWESLSKNRQNRVKRLKSWKVRSETYKIFYYRQKRQRLNWLNIIGRQL